mmetsp:Transcript_68312/g.149097  ORF Transcript_68312/g.149097 Transcript_68312/m.149097 type:complete len:197 (-) Transcript_68312:50-640(-)
MREEVTSPETSHPAGASLESPLTREGSMMETIPPMAQSQLGRFPGTLTPPPSSREVSTENSIVAATRSQPVPTDSQSQGCNNSMAAAAVNQNSSSSSNNNNNTKSNHSLQDAIPDFNFANNNNINTNMLTRNSNNSNNNNNNNATSNFAHYAQSPRATFPRPSPFSKNRILIGVQQPQTQTSFMVPTRALRPPREL